MAKYTFNDIELGDEVKDTITGYKGKVVAFTTWLNGCRRIAVQARGLVQGKPSEPQTFDIEQLEVLHKAERPKKVPTGGGGRPDAVAHTTPRR